MNTNKRRKSLSLQEGLLKSKMKTIWIDGKKMAEEITRDLIKRINQLRRIPELDVIWIGDNPASAIYVQHKQKKAEQLGMRVRVHHLPETITFDELHALIEKLNQDDNVDGIMVQMPLPRHLNSDEVLDMVSPDKDVDGLTTVNLGRLVWGGAKLVACTPQACMRLIESVVPNLSGKTCRVLQEW